MNKSEMVRLRRWFGENATAATQSRRLHYDHLLLSLDNLIADPDDDVTATECSMVVGTSESNELPSPAEDTTNAPSSREREWPRAAPPPPIARGPRSVLGS